ncbi:DUF6252 family protein [Spongiivirga sp. MCCC 1A20706]|uniref:DUF6252 family protein n=1 Tax=Spongiivirga sp. MCCC 1A20706 TaxID=3160963 RepID=UPI003977A998
MKKVLFLFVLLCAMVSCEDDIDDNTPAFQGTIDGEFFRATELSVQPGEDDVWILEGSMTVEKITLQIVDLNTGIYDLGQNLRNTGTYSIEGEVSFFTGETGNTGNVTISEYNTEEGFISGVFKFTANNEDGSVNVQDGIFYRVPIMGTPPAPDPMP